jgi:putrescine transport system substrate-binding protein
VRRHVLVERLCDVARPGEGGGLERQPGVHGTSLLIPEGAPDRDAAYQFINFILRPDVIAEITNAIYYGNDNIASRPLVDSRILHDDTLYPTPEIEARLYRSAEVNAATERLRTRTWTRIKTGE